MTMGIAYLICLAINVVLMGLIICYLIDRSDDWEG